MAHIDHPSGRRTQLERTEETRARCLTAMLETLCEKGYAASNTTDVAKRAGVSRGALTHHFPLKVDLAVGALEQAYATVLSTASEIGGKVADPHARLSILFDWLWGQGASTAFVAGFELIAAARIDEELREKFEPYMRRFNDQMLRWWLSVTSDMKADEMSRAIVLDLTVSMVRGEAMRLRFDQSGPRIGAKKAAWRSFFDLQLGFERGG